MLDVSTAKLITLSVLICCLFALGLDLALGPLDLGAVILLIGFESEFIWAVTHPNATATVSEQQQNSSKTVVFENVQILIEDNELQKLIQDEY